MPITHIVEERYRDIDLPLVNPERKELFCRSGPGVAWGFSIAGFGDDRNKPIEMEITGSGGYATQDEFSMAAVDRLWREGW